MDRTVTYGSVAARPRRHPGAVAAWRELHVADDRRRAGRRGSRRWHRPGPSLVMLTAAQLTDGPWCPDAASANRYDADLLRIRKVRVTIRLQTGNAALRGLARHRARRVVRQPRHGDERSPYRAGSIHPVRRQPTEHESGQVSLSTTPRTEAPRRCGSRDERGVALLVALMAMLLVMALGTALILTPAWNRRSRATSATAPEALYAADAGARARG